MAELVNIHQPANGVVRGEPSARKRLASAYDAENMLMRDTGTGQRRLSVRPGLDRLFGVNIGEDGAPLSCVFPLRWATSGEDYALLDGADIETEWAESSSDAEPAVSVAVDARGGSYFLTRSGMLYKRASNGETVFFSTVQAPTGFTIVPRILVDPLGGVFCAASSNRSGVPSRIFRFAPRVDGEGVDIDWIFEIEGAQIADITRRGGQLFAAVNEPIRASHVAAIENAVDGTPFQSWTMPTPYPLSEIAYGNGLIFTCPPDPDRGSGAPINGDESVWNLSALAAADERVHAVFDARLAGDFPDGARVTAWTDARGRLGIGAHDQTNRDFSGASWFNPAANSGSPGPRFRRQLADGEAAFAFSASEGLPHENGFRFIYDNGCSLWNRSLEGDFAWRVDKPSADGELPRSTGLFPHTLTHKYAIAFKLRWPANISAGVAYIAGGFIGAAVGPAYKDNHLAVIVQDSGGANVTQTEGAICIRGILDTGAGRFVAGTGVKVNDAWEAIVVIEQRGGAISRVRINGAVVATGITVRSHDMQSPAETLGNRVYFEGSLDPLLHDDGLDGADSYTGALQFMATIFGESSGPGVHDLEVPLAEIQKIEGSLAWRGAAGDILDGAHPYKAAPPLLPSPNTIIDETAVARALRSPDGIVGRLSPGLDVIPWAVAGSGIGFSVTASPLGEIYTAGPRLVDVSLPSDEGPRAVIYRRMLDRGYSVDYLAPSAGEIVLSGQPAVGDWFDIDPGSLPIRFEFGGVGTPSMLYVPVAIGASVAATAQNFLVALTLSEFYPIGKLVIGDGVYSFPIQSRLAPTNTPAPIGVFSPGGHLRVTSGMDGGNASPGTWDFRADLDGSISVPGIHIHARQGGDLFAPRVNDATRNLIVRIAKDDGSLVFSRAIGTDLETIWDCATDPRIVNFGADIESPEFLWVAQDAVKGHRKLRLVSRTPNGEAPQREAYFIVKGGLAFVAYDDGSVAPLPMEEPFSYYDPRMQVVDYRGDLLISDGQRRMVWSPKNGTFEEWTAKKGTELPTSSRIMTAWNARVFLTGADLYTWLASAIGDYTDFDAFPVDRSANQAASSDSGDGQTQTQDQITGLIPIGDDLLLVLGATTISRLTGDPMAGGYLDNVSRGVGGSFGQAWAHRPEGGAFFFGVPNAVYAVNAAGTEIKNVSIDHIEEDLRSVDLGAYTIRMAYSHRMEGLCVIPVPIDLSATFDQRWWFMDRFGAWWPQSWSSRAHQPTVVTASIGSGEPILGCFDGHVRILSRKDGTDDGQEITSSITFGPYFDRQYHKKSRFRKGFARFEAEAPIEWYAYVEESPLRPGAPATHGLFIPSEPEAAGFRIKGRAFWFELRGFGVDWAFEEGGFVRIPAGVHK